MPSAGNPRIWLIAELCLLPSISVAWTVVQSLRSKSSLSFASLCTAGMLLFLSFASCSRELSSSLEDFFCFFLKRLPNTLFLRPFLSFSLSRISSSALVSGYPVELIERERLLSSFSRSVKLVFVVDACDYQQQEI